MRSAEDWRWSSLWQRLPGRLCRLLEGGPVALPGGWMEYVNRPETEAELEALRRSVIRGSPFGGPPWVERTAKLLGLEATLRPPGRPKQASAKHENSGAPVHDPTVIGNRQLAIGIFMDIPRIQAPIVLVHGLFGFDRLRLGGMTLANYFPGIVDLFVAAGNRVLVPSLSPTAGIVQRAQQLKDFLESAAPQQAVHIIAHSLGGLDARYMISRLDMAGCVLTLTTLGTPHRGTAFADWSVNRLERVLQPVFSLLQIPTQAFFDLTRPACARFNDQVPDAPGVRYFSVAGRHDGSLRNPEWLLPYHIVLEAEGPNDGVVSLASAGYGENLEVWEGDHFSLVNWPNPLGINRSLGRDPRPRYGGLLCRLAAAGY